METIRESFTWQGLVIEALYVPNWSETYRVTYSYALAHLQVTSAERAPLPISETGYLSHFERADNIAAAGGAAAHARAWLEHAVQSPAWLIAQAEARQFSLF